MAEDADTSFHFRPSVNLWRRIVSGAVMGAATLGVLYAGPTPFAVLLMMVAIMMSWEWGRMVRATLVDPAFLVHAAIIAGTSVLTVLGYPLMAIATLAAGAVLVLIVDYASLRTAPSLAPPQQPPFQRAPLSRAMTSAMGVVYVGLPTIALLWIRADSSYGFQAALFLLILVWAADTAAFVGGKTIGGLKLWPSISPNKTWAGFIFAVLAAGAVGAAAGMIYAPNAIASMIIKSSALGAIAQFGDLAESAFKRSFGVKDTSDLIPGHGGFMDRMDGVVAVALAAGLFAVAVQSTEPARTLLFGTY